MDIFDDAIDAGMRTLSAKARETAGHRSPLLIVGEPGSGRRSLARYIHERGGGGPFAAIECEKLESLRFLECESAGTVFLAGVDALAAPLARQLVEWIEGNRFAARVMAGAEPLPLAGKESARAALLAAIGRQTIELPALRDRAADIPLLVEAILADQPGPVATMGEGTMGYLLNYDWPGNVTELHQVVGRLCTLASDSVLSPDDLPPQVRWFRAGETQRPAAAKSEQGFNPLAEEFQYQLIADALRRTRG